MQLTRRAFQSMLVAGLATPLLADDSRAQGYPSRPVRMIVPFAPAGQTDVIGRLLAQQLSEQLGKQFYVENVSGAGGTIGCGRVAQSAPDGYTLLTTDGTSFVVNPHLHEKVPYDPFRDFVPVSLAATTTQVLTVNPALPVRSVAELVALVKREPGKYSFSSPGVGTPGHLTGELFRLTAGLDLLHVPFGGAGPAVISTVAGHTPIGFGSPAATVPQILDGKLRALAVASKARLPALSDIPTMAEAGMPEVECDVWLGSLLPAATPTDIIETLRREINAIVAAPEMQKKLGNLGFVPYAPAPEAAVARIREESAKWEKVIRAAKLTVR